MARVAVRVVDGILSVPGLELEPPAAVPIGTPAWFGWLARARAFAFAGAAGHFTARREARAGGQYWYGYRRQAGVLHTAYLGRDADLTLPTLDRVAARLAGPPAPRVPRPAWRAGYCAPLASLSPPPPCPDLLPRPHLIARLNAGLARPLTLVVAPAGFGKTTLLAAWAAQWPGPLAWITLTARDNDPARFWDGIDAALAQIASSPGAPSAPAPAGSADPAAPPPGVLVLDDFPTIRIPGLAARLAAHAPARHLIIATRAAPPGPLAPLRAAGRVAEIGPAELRFTPAEAGAFLRGALGAAHPAADIATLAAQAEGWIAGLHLLALAAQEGGAPPAGHPARPADPRYVYAFLAEHVFDRVSAGVQQFLLDTAILDRLSGPLCQAVTTRPDAAAHLAALGAAGFFLTPLDAAGHWYRYHALFATFLRRRLAGMTPDPRPALHGRAAAWYAAHDDPTAAVPHALAAGDFATATTLISRSAPALVQRGEWATIRGWLDALPAALVHARPDLAIWGAWMGLLSGQLATVEPHLRAAERALPAPGAAAEPARATYARGQILVIRAALACARGEARPGRAFVLQAQTLFHRAAGADSAMQGLLWLYLGQARLLQHNAPAAAPALIRARQVSQAGGHVYTAVGALALQAEGALAQGRLFEAETCYRQALHLATGPDGRCRPAAGLAFVGLGALHYEWNDLERAADDLAQGRALAERAGHGGALLAGCLAFARVQQARGDWVAASALLAEAALLADRRQVPHDRARVAAGQARLALAQGGDLADALARLQAALPAPADALGWAAEYATLARLLLALGRIAEAEALLERLEREAGAAGYTGRRVECLALEALAWQRRGAPARAAATLAGALALAAPGGYIRLVVDEGPALSRLVSAARAGGDRAYTAALLRAFAAEPAGPPPTGRPAALTAREQDVLALLARGLAYGAIAQHLVVSENTARWHIRNLYRKLGARRRAQAIRRGQEQGLLS